MGDLYKKVRTRNVLYRAWRRVRRNINRSNDHENKALVKQLDEDPFRFLDGLYRSLLNGTYNFQKQRGYVKDRKRGIVVSPISNRVVQRAILDVLQSDSPQIGAMLGKVPAYLNSPYSVGGIPERGVQCGIEIITKAIGDGATHYYRSDIQQFFTNVPKSAVMRILSREIKDKALVRLIEAGLSTELENEEEIKAQLFMFPLGDKGVPQGSSLSALAANIVLEEFDRELNHRGIRTVRYIDDFVILGPNPGSVAKAFSKGQEILADLGLSSYDCSDGSGKAAAGVVEKGFEFLGCQLEGSSVSVSPRNCHKLLEQIDKSIQFGRKNIKRLTQDSNPRRADAVLIQTLQEVDLRIRGWGDSFQFTNNRLPMHRLDEKIDEKINEYIGWSLNRLKGLDLDQRRRGWGISLLKDIPLYDPRPSNGT